MIVCRAGEVTTREELYAELSSHSSYDFKHGLNNAIQKIREVLGDSPENARLIRHGSRAGLPVSPQVEVISDPSVRNGNRKSAAENDAPVLRSLDCTLALSALQAVPALVRWSYADGRYRRTWNAKVVEMDWSCCCPCRCWIVRVLSSSEDYKHCF